LNGEMLSRVLTIVIGTIVIALIGAVVTTVQQTHDNAEKLKIVIPRVNENSNRFNEQRQSLVRIDTLLKTILHNQEQIQYDIRNMIQEKSQ